MGSKAFDHPYGTDPLSRPLRKVVKPGGDVAALICGHVQPVDAGVLYARCEACGDEARVREAEIARLRPRGKLPWLAKNLTDEQCAWLGFRHFDHPNFKYITTRSHEFFFPELFESFFPYLVESRLICNGYVQLLSPSLIIQPGYAWDGPSGPAVDSLNFAFGSMGHDGGYQGMRTSELPQEARPAVDRLMRRTNLESGMLRIRAWYTWLGVRMFAGSYAQPRERNMYRDV